MPRSGFDKNLAGRLRSPRVLRQTPIDPFEEVAELRRRDHHRPIHSRWPDEAATFQPLRKQAHALPVMPQHLDQATATAAEHEQMAVVRIALERLLYQQRQAVEALAHVRAAGRQPHLRAARNRDHRRLAFASAATITLTVDASTGPVIRIRAPVANSTSIAPGVVGSAVAAPGPGAIATGENTAAAGAAPQSCCRHRNNWRV